MTEKESMISYTLEKLSDRYKLSKLSAYEENIGFYSTLHMMHHIPNFNHLQFKELILKAKMNLIHYDILKKVCSKFLEKHQKEIPIEIRMISSELLNGEFIKPSTNRQGNTVSISLETRFTLKKLVHYVRKEYPEIPIKKGRSAIDNNLTICDVVSEATKASDGENYTYNTVHDSYYKHLTNIKLSGKLT